MRSLSTACPLASSWPLANCILNSLCTGCLVLSGMAFATRRVRSPSLSVWLAAPRKSVRASWRALRNRSVISG